MGTPDYRRLQHFRHLQQNTLNLERSDPVARRFDYIIIAAYEPDIALLILEGFVAGIIETVTEDFRFLLRRPDVRPEDTIEPFCCHPHGNLPFFMQWHLGALIV